MSKQSLIFKDMDKTIQELKEENAKLLEKRSELWRQIKDFDTTSYHRAESVGKLITKINRQIAKNKAAIDYKNNPLENG